MFVSEYLGLDYIKLEDMGVFDAVMEKDSRFFINVQRLKKTTVPEFINSYKTIREFFTSIATILDAADQDNNEDKFFKAALKMFDFSEVNEINLGFSDAQGGSGMGKVLRKQIISDAYNLVKKGCKAPELFEMIGLFEEGVGPDRLSDMIATIILPDIQAYTKRIMSELGVGSCNCDTIEFDSEGYVINKFKHCRLYLLPTNILHELPVAKCWADIDTVASKNRVFRQELNFEVAAAWTKWNSSQRKAYIKNQLMSDPDIFNRFVEAYRKETADEYNIYSDSAYFIEKLLQKIKTTADFQRHDKEEIDSLSGTLEALEIFKHWVEHNKGWDEINRASSEKSVQRFIHACVKYYMDVNNLDFSCEANEGAGPVDFKVSRGNDCTVVELKLSSNSGYMHGYQVQIVKYAEAESTDKMVFVLVDIGNSRRVKNLLKQHEQDIQEGKRVAEIIIIDATPKQSASKKVKLTHG